MQIVEFIFSVNCKHSIPAKMEYQLEGSAKDDTGDCTMSSGSEKTLSHQFTLPTKVSMKPIIIISTYHGCMAPLHRLY
jgi:hypothetical protein